LPIASSDQSLCNLLNGKAFVSSPDFAAFKGLQIKSFSGGRILKSLVLKEKKINYEAFEF
jgi:hypothetical protein